MSDGTASLRAKIDSAEDLQSVVRTMKALAAANIGQYEKSVKALGDYYRTVELALSTCFHESAAALTHADAASHPKPSVLGAVVFGSDQGLVGRFNEVVAEHALQSLTTWAGEVRVWAVGERVLVRLVDAGIPVQGHLSVPGSVGAIAPLAGRILVESEASHKHGEISRLQLFYNRPTAAAGYEPVSQRLLPLDENWRRGLAELRWPTQNLPEVVGERTATLRALIREYLFISLFRACSESLASENASRLAAMQRADQNIDELLADVRGSFRRVRQNGIDEELFDVVSGFEALSARSAQ